MKKLCILFLILSPRLFAQKKEPTLSHVKLTETDSLYSKAFDIYVSQVDTYYKGSTQEGSYPQNVYLQYENYLSKIPDKIGNYSIIKLGFPNRGKHFRKNKNNLRMVIVRPLSIHNGEFYINVVPYFAELDKKNNLTISLSSWVSVYFEFVNGKLIYSRTENGGI